jgi:hypothetical protein
MIATDNDGHHLASHHCTLELQAGTVLAVWRYCVGVPHASVASRHWQWTTCELDAVGGGGTVHIHLFIVGLPIIIANIIQGRCLWPVGPDQFYQTGLWWPSVATSKPSKHCKNLGSVRQLTVKLGSNMHSQRPLDLYTHFCHLKYAPNKARVFFKLTNGAFAFTYGTVIHTVV